MKKKAKICNRSNKNKNKGYGLIDYILNKLPNVEFHLPGYSFCGPNTRVKARLARGETGINKLDEACKDHDIAYSTLKNSESRREADKALVARALTRIYSQDAKLSERAAALLVSGLMGAKIGLSKMGLGLGKRSNKRSNRKKMKSRRRRAKVVKRRVNRRKKNQSKLKRKSITFGKLVRGVRASIKKSKSKSSSLNDTIKAAIRNGKEMKRNKTVKMSRVLKLPKFGGSVLPILPILSALSAVGSISASTAAVVKAIKEIQNIKKHDISTETKKKIGSGLYLMRNATGSGFYLKPFRQR